METTNPMVHRCEVCEAILDGDNVTGVDWVRYIVPRPMKSEKTCRVCVSCDEDFDECARILEEKYGETNV